MVAQVAAIFIIGIWTVLWASSHVWERIHFRPETFLITFVAFLLPSGLFSIAAMLGLNDTGVASIVFAGAVVIFLIVSAGYGIALFRLWKSNMEVESSFYARRTFKRQYPERKRNDMKSMLAANSGMRGSDLSDEPDEYLRCT